MIQVCVKCAWTNKEIDFNNEKSACWSSEDDMNCNCFWFYGLHSRGDTPYKDCTTMFFMTQKNVLLRNWKDSQFIGKKIQIQKKHTHLSLLLPVPPPLLQCWCIHWFYQNPLLKMSNPRRQLVAGTPLWFHNRSLQIGCPHHGRHQSSLVQNGPPGSWFAS